MKTSKALTAARATARRSPAWDRGSDTAAATLRQQGHISRPRVVWVNNTQGPIKRPRKKD